MSFETFEIVYFCASVIGAAFGLWLLRKSKDDLLSLLMISSIPTMFRIAFYIDVKKGNIDGGELMGYLLRGLTYVEPDLILVISNSLLWCVVPFAAGIWLYKKKKGDSFVWLFFIGFALFKTIFDDRIIIHQYPEILVFSFDWGFVLFDWLIIYAIAALFVTKGIKSLSEKEQL
jgi:hypothetical protein